MSSYSSLLSSNLDLAGSITDMSSSITLLSDASVIVASSCSSVSADDSNSMASVSSDIASISDASVAADSACSSDASVASDASVTAASACASQFAADTSTIESLSSACLIPVAPLLVSPGPIFPVSVPGAPRYYLVQNQTTFSNAKAHCHLADVNSGNVAAISALLKNKGDHAYIGSWRGSNYGGTTCIAIYQGGAIAASPARGCNGLLPYICQR